MIKKTEKAEEPRDTVVFSEGVVKEDDYKSRTFSNMVQYYLNEQNMKWVEVVERSEISYDNLKRYVNEKRTPSRENVIRIAMAMMLDIKSANRLLKSLRYADLNKTYKSDKIILEYYDAVVEEFKNSTNLKADNQKIYKLNQALCDAGCEKLFEGRYL